MTCPERWPHSVPVVLAGIACVAVVGSRRPGADVHHVPGDYYTIQHALIVSLAGDTVLVAAGEYYESIVWPGTPSIRLLSEAGAESTTVDGMAVDSVVRILEPQDSTTIISGFTFRNGDAERGGGIRCEDAAPRIIGNTFEDNTALWYGGGVYFAGDHAVPILTDNIFTANRVMDGSGGAIGCMDGATPRIERNVITGNRADAYFGGGIHCEETSSCMGGVILIADNTIRNNHAAGGGGLSLFAPFAQVPQVTRNEIRENSADYGGGVYAYWTLADIDGNVIAENTAVEDGGGILANQSHELVVRDNEIHANSAGADGGGIAFVMWSTTPEVTANRITGNRASRGGGVYCYNRSSPTLSENLLRANEATGTGGAVFCERWCSPVLNNNMVIENLAPNTGGIFLWESDALVRECTIRDNQDAGFRLGLAREGHPPELRENSITGHAGYGVCNEDGSVRVDAVYNWWGDPSGPYHATENPAGTGDRVSDHVDFAPWLQNPEEVAGVRPGAMADRVHLQLYPNPATANVTFAYRVGGDAETPRTGEIAIYDVSGRLLRRLPVQLLHGQPTGRTHWDGRDAAGSPVPAGNHSVVLRLGSQRQARRLTLLR